MINYERKNEIKIVSCISHSKIMSIFFQGNTVLGFGNLKGELVYPTQLDFREI